MADIKTLSANKKTKKTALSNAEKEFNTALSNTQNTVCDDLVAHLSSLNHTDWSACKAKIDNSSDLLEKIKLVIGFCDTNYPTGTDPDVDAKLNDLKNATDDLLQKFDALEKAEEAYHIADTALRDGHASNHLRSNETTAYLKQLISDMTKNKFIVTWVLMIIIAFLALLALFNQGYDDTRLVKKVASLESFKSQALLKNNLVNEINDSGVLNGLLTEIKASTLYQPSGSYALKSDISGLAKQADLTQQAKRIASVENNVIKLNKKLDSLVKTTVPEMKAAVLVELNKKFDLHNSDSKKAIANIQKNVTVLKNAVSKSFTTLEMQIKWSFIEECSGILRLNDTPLCDSFDWKAEAKKLEKEIQATAKAKK